MRLPKGMSMSNLTNELLRLNEIIKPGGPLPIARSTWFLWVKDGTAPPPLKLGRRVSVYRRSDIESFLDNKWPWRKL